MIRRRRETFADRAEGAAALVAALVRLGGRDDVVVLGLPRGGVPIASRLATQLPGELGVVAVRKLVLPARRDLAVGAIAEYDGAVAALRNDDLAARFGVDAGDLDRAEAAARAELGRQLGRVPPRRLRVPVRGRVVIVVDDGLATGTTMRAAVEVVRRAGPAGVVVAAPVGSREACADLATVADEVVCPLQPRPFSSVSAGYRDFRPVDTAVVERLLA